MEKSLQALLDAGKPPVDESVFERLGSLCAGLANNVLVEGLTALNDRETRSLAVVLAVLGELEERKTVVAGGASSLFRYCVDTLGYSEDQACARIRAAKAAKKYPRILSMIAGQTITVTAVSRIYPFLTPENYRSLLGKASRRSLSELDRLVAAMSPREEPRPMIRALSVGSNEPAADPAQPRLELSAEQPRTEPPGFDGEEPERHGRVLFRFAASEAFRAKFERAREIMRHVAPTGSPEVIFDKALEALLDRRDPMRQHARKERRAAARRSQTARP